MNNNLKYILIAIAIFVVVYIIYKKKKNSDEQNIRVIKYRKGQNNHSDVIEKVINVRAEDIIKDVQAQLQKIEKE